MLIVLGYIGIGLGALVGAYVVFMLVIAIIPGVSAPPQRLSRRSERGEEETTTERKEVSFDVAGTAVSGWLFLPQDASTPVPCIVMAHGLGATKAAGLSHYAARFREAGFAVLAFDYRHLGESSGEPRQLVWIPRQLEDYAAAVAYARGLEGIDPDRIALWGTSLSGGHVIVTAAKDERIACVAAQVPLLAGDAGGMDVVRKLGLGYILRLAFGHGLRDLVRSWLRLSPHKIPIVGKPGTIALMADADAWTAFERIAPADFVNEACARILIRMDKYHPINHTKRVGCPILMQAADKDISLPIAVVERAETRLGKRAEVIRYPIDHFDIYLGDHFETAVTDQLAFFKKHLEPAS